MASLGQIYDLLRKMGLVDGHQRKEPITPEEVQLLNELLKEGKMGQLLDLVSCPVPPREDPPGQDPRGHGQITDPDAPPWD